MQANISNIIIYFICFNHFFKTCGKRGWWETNYCMLAVRIEPQATEKFFGAAVFQKCCRGVGEQPTFAKQIVFAVCFSCCNCIFWNCPIQIKLNCENQDCKFRQGNGAIAARWQAKAGVEPPFAGWERPFSLREVISITSRRQTKVFWSNNFSKMLARFRASSPDRCPQAAKSLCHAFGTRRGWWEKRQLFEGGANKTAPPCLPFAVMWFWKRSGGTFPTGFSFAEIDGHGTTCPYGKW